MKKYMKYLLSALFFWVCLSSCDLDEYPQATASSVAIFGSASGLELYSNSFYEMLPTPYDGVFLIDDNCDLVARNGISTQLLPNALSAITSSGWSWSELRNINYFIENFFRIFWAIFFIILSSALE